MKIRARRGVCIGVDRHLQPGDLADLDAAQVTFLEGIGAVEQVPEEPATTSHAKANTSAVPTSTTTKPDHKDFGQSGKKEK
jgi:hypothetical protein